MCQLWALHVFIKQQFFYICSFSIAQNQFQQRETKDRHIGIILLPFMFDFPLVTGISVCIKHEGETASPCQIWSTSVKPRLKYGDFSIFQDGGRRHLGFSKF